MKVYTLVLDADGWSSPQGVFSTLEAAQESAMGLIGPWKERTPAYCPRTRWTAKADASEDSCYASWYEIQEWELDEP